MPASSEAHVGKRIVLTVLWTILLIVGLTIGILALVPNVQTAIQNASRAVAGGAVAPSIAAALVLPGLWGLPANHRNLKHAGAIISRADRPRQETLPPERTRYTQ